jgi:hypothetical protein
VAPVHTYTKDGGVSGRPSFVAVMQPADLGQRHDRSHFWRLNPSRLGRVFPQGEMRSRSVIVIQIGTKDTTEGRFMEHENAKPDFRDVAFSPKRRS